MKPNIQLRMIMCWCIFTFPLSLHSALANEQPELKVVQIGAPTRIDCDYVMSRLGELGERVPEGYDSTKQKYAKYVPPSYDAKKNWPLLINISASDEAKGWDYWKNVCEKNAILYCEPLKAGNDTQVAQRTRMVLDTLDDMRRKYKIDVQRTYLTGFSGGGFMTCLIGMSLPEQFGGIIPICASKADYLFAQLPYTRERIRDRLSIAVLTCERDFNRSTAEYSSKIYQEYSIHDKLWVAKGKRHEAPPQEILEEAYTWIKADVKRRAEDAEKYPELVIPPDSSREMQAKRILSFAEKTAKKEEGVGRAGMILESIAPRWPGTESVDKAAELMKEWTMDEKWRNQIEAYKQAEEARLYLAFAKGLDFTTVVPAVVKPPRKVVEPTSDAAKHSNEELKKVAESLEKKAYLGLTFNDGNNGVLAVYPKHKPNTPNTLPGDRLCWVCLGFWVVQTDLERILAKHKPGDTLEIERIRGKDREVISVEVGSRAFHLR